MFLLKIIGFPERDESNSSSKISVLPSGRDSPGRRGQLPGQVALARVRWSLAGQVDANGVARHQHPAILGDVVQHEPIGRAIHRPLDARERHGMERRRKFTGDRARRREPDLGSRWRPRQSNAGPVACHGGLAAGPVDDRDHRLGRTIKHHRTLEERHATAVGRHPQRPRGRSFMDGRAGGELDGPGTIAPRVSDDGERVGARDPIGVHHPGEHVTARSTSHGNARQQCARPRCA